MILIIEHNRLLILVRFYSKITLEFLRIKVVVMAAIEPDKKEREVSVSAKFPESLRKEMDAYMKYAGFKSVNKFMVKTVKFLFDKDKSWRKQRNDFLGKED